MYQCLTSAAVTVMWEYFPQLLRRATFKGVAAETSAAYTEYSGATGNSQPRGNDVNAAAETNAMPSQDGPGSYINVISDIVSAYVSNNSLRPSDLPDLIASVHASIQMIAKGEIEAPAAAPLVPAVPVKKSVTKDFLICLEDGKKFRSLKRHLGSVYSMTPDEYRQKWGLPSDYPMVAPGYSEVRSQLAKEIGLGQQRSAPAVAAAEPAAAAPARAKRASAAG